MTQLHPHQRSRFTFADSNFCSSEFNNKTTLNKELSRKIEGKNPSSYHFQPENHFLFFDFASCFSFDTSFCAHSRPVFKKKFQTTSQVWSFCLQQSKGVSSKEISGLAAVAKLRQSEPEAKIIGFCNTAIHTKWW